MRALFKNICGAAGTLAAVAILAIPAAMVLSSPSPDAAQAAVSSRSAENSSLATLLTGSAIETSQQESISPVGAMLVASTVAFDTSAPPYYYFGDVNNDGKTDIADFGILKENFGMGITGGIPLPGRADGDLTGDRRVDTDDFGVIKFYFGKSSPYVL